MKKILIAVLAVAVAAGFAFTAMAKEKVEVKEKTTASGKTVEKAKWNTEESKGKEKTVTTDKKTTTTVKAKDKTTGTKVKSKTVEQGDTTYTEEKAKGKNVKMEKKEIETPEGAAGKVKVNVKKGHLKKLNIEYVYYKEGDNYIIEYKIKDKKDKDLQTELGLTDQQCASLKPGYHKITSTSPYTAGDVQGDFRSIIIKDIAATYKK